MEDILSAQEAREIANSIPVSPAVMIEIRYAVEQGHHRVEIHRSLISDKDIRFLRGLGYTVYEPLPPADQNYVVIEWK